MIVLFILGYKACEDIGQQLKLKEEQYIPEVQFQTLTPEVYLQDYKPCHHGNEE
jgi:hypothetical protein